jgi:CRISPR/Cas system-associated exonuclease Cas4 (RecB family)
MRAGFRRGSHHFHLLPVLVIVVLLAVVSYQVAVHSNLWHSLHPERGDYLVKVIGQNGEEIYLFEDAVVEVDDGRLVVEEDGKTVYYPISPSARVEVRRVRVER